MIAVALNVQFVSDESWNFERAVHFWVRAITLKYQFVSERQSLPVLITDVGLLSIFHVCTFGL